MENINHKQVSVILPVFPDKKHAKEAIESVLAQTFVDFELIIIENGITDNMFSIIHNIADKRIIHLQNEQDIITSLNLGLCVANGKYVICMDANDLMHVDRLKIQYTIMEEEPKITVCGTWIQMLDKDVLKGSVLSSFSGWIKNPLLQFLKIDVAYYPAAMIRKSFLERHHLNYESYAPAENYKLWVEIAKCGGQFHIESLPMLFKRISADQVDLMEKKETQIMTWLIKQEIVYALLNQCGDKHGILKQAYNTLLKLKESELISEQQIVDFLYTLMRKVSSENKCQCNENV